MSLVKRARKVEVYKWSAGAWAIQDHVFCALLTRAVGPDLPAATLVLHTGYVAGTPPTVYRADHHTLLSLDDRVLIRFADEEGGELEGGPVLLEGYCLGPEIGIESEAEGVSWTVKSVGLRMQELFPVGCWSRGYGDFADGAPVATKRTHFYGLPPVFNDGGKPNASKVWFSRDSVSRCPLFAPLDDATLSEDWTYRTALLYCFEHLAAEAAVADPVASFVFPTPAELSAVSALAATPKDLSIEGLSWWEAIVQLCQRAGCRVYFRTAGTAAAIVHELIVFALGSGTEKTVKLQAPGSLLDPELSQTSRVDLALDASGLANSPVLLGSRLVVEGTWPLVPGWKTADVPATYDPSSGTYRQRYLRGGEEPGDGKDHAAYRDAGRLWILNEAGQASDAAHGSQPLFDLSAVVAGSWARRPRPLERPLSYREKGQPLDALVEISFDAGSHWQTLEGVSLLKDAAGLHLTATNLDDLLVADDSSSTCDTYWEAVITDLANVMVRVTAGLQDDGRLLATPEVPAGCPVSRAVQWLFDRRDAYLRAVRLESGDYLSQFYVQGLSAETRSDGTKLSDEASRLQAVTALPTVRCSVTLEDVEYDYEPGDLLTAIAGRGISLGVGGGMAGGPFYPQIVAVNLTFGESYVMELVLEDHGKAVAR